MSDLEDELAAHLAGKASPFLFVGAGMSRRYVGLDGWEGLLRRFADITGKPYGQYNSDAGQRFPAIASAIAEDFNPIWWSGDEYAERRERFQDELRDKESPLKVEVARLVSDIAERLDLDGVHAGELKALREVIVDGIITTNYDPLLEQLFPEFKCYVGQQELLFSEVQSVGEIFKIHGSHERPDSLVLTQSDYDAFDRDNPYLAAKLLTIFVDHPIVFLGYSIGDSNVQRILEAIARALSAENLQKLTDRLVYVTWNKDAPAEPHLGHGSMRLEGGVIPMRTVEVSDFTPVFRALGRAERKLPAKILRQLKERVYDLVLTSDPVGALKVVNIEDEVGDMDVVFGVGAIDRLGSLGYFGVDRDRVITDVLDDDGAFNPDVIVKDVLPPILKQAKFTPVMKYLRGAGLLTDAGKLNATKDVDGLMSAYVTAGRKPFGPTVESYKKADKKLAKKVKTFDGLLEAVTDRKKVLRIVHAFKGDAVDLDGLREYLSSQRDMLEGGGSDRTLFAKAVCLYDWLRYATA